MGCNNVGHAVAAASRFTEVSRFTDLFLFLHFWAYRWCVRINLAVLLIENTRFPWRL